MIKKNGLELVRIRMVPDRTLQDNVPVSNPDEAVRVLTREFGDLDREVFMVINLTNQMNVINANICSVGTLTYTAAEPREIFKSAILSNAAYCLVLHNHPSGNLEPSEQDIEVTRRLVSAGRILGIEVVDHLIIGQNEMEYVSLREQGLMETDASDWRKMELAADRQPENKL